MRKFLCVIFALCFVSLGLVAQDVKDLKNVKLKSGITITGYVKNDTDGSIIVTTPDGDQLWYSSAEIQSITDDPSAIEARKKEEENVKKEAELQKAREKAEQQKALEEAEQQRKMIEAEQQRIIKETEERKAKEQAEAKAAKRALRESVQMKNDGFQLMVEYDLGLASNNRSTSIEANNNLWSLSLTPSYRLNQNLLAGVGVGMRTLGWHISDDVYQYCLGKSFSFSGKAIYNFKTGHITPYLGLNAGYSLISNLDFYGNQNNEYGWFDHSGHLETAHGIGSYFIGGDLGWFFITLKSFIYNIGASITYFPPPSSVHGITIDNTISVAAKIGLVF